MVDNESGTPSQPDAATPGGGVSRAESRRAGHPAAMQAAAPQHEAAPQTPSPAEPQLDELIDFNLFNDIFENFLAVTGLPIAIIDLHGKVLAASHWPHFCTEFHRARERTQAACLVSDKPLARRLKAGKDWQVYRCANGLIDCATPIVIEGHHAANLFAGPFLLEAPAHARPGRRRRTCPLDPSAYAAAVAEMPVIAAGKIPPVLDLLRSMAQQITHLSLGQHRLLAVLVNIERQVAERTGRLTESEDRFRALFADSPLGQLLIDQENQRIIACNQVAADTLGYRREELEAMRLTDCKIALDRAELHALRDRLLAGEVVRFETQVQRKGGSRRDLEVTVGTLRARGGVHFHVTHLDITARKVAEQEQRRLTRALRLLGNCNQAMIRAQDEHELLAACCRLIVKSDRRLRSGWIGQPAAEAGGGLHPIARFGRRDQHGDDTLAIGALRGRRTRIEQSATCTRIAVPIQADGVVLGILALRAGSDGFDADEVALLEELAGNMAYGIKALRLRVELEEHRASLENRVAARTREIAALNAELKERAIEAEATNRTKSDFLATVSHELRTPLNAVVGFAGLLADSQLDRDQRDFAGKILSAAQTLRALIDNILDFSKIEAGALQLEQAPFSLNAILRTTANVIAIGIRGKPIEALLDIAPDVPDTLVGDALRLQQILLNLGSNAIKYTESGTILVSVRSLVRQANTVTLRFAVRDTGIGIRPEDRTRIFGAFTQADSSTSRRYGGTGLGLPISVRLATLMGGTIGVDSVEHWGSEFTLTLPLNIAEEQRPPACGDVPAGLRLLIVDDQALSRDILARYCRHFGWQTSAVDSGATALAELRRGQAEGHGYDMLLLDWRMPGLDGIATLRQAHATPGIALPLVVLMVAGFELEQAAAASDDLPLEGILAKPVMPESLYEAVYRAYTGIPAKLPMPAPNGGKRRLAGLRLLVVEDNDLNQQLIERILRHAGATVHLCSDGQAAIDTLKAQPAAFDAVLMDIQMPVMDGYEAARIIRQELGLHRLPIIAVTAHARPEDRERSRLAGMDGHLIKPIDVDNLLDAITGQRPEQTVSAPPADIDLATVQATFGADLSDYTRLLRQFVDMHGGDTARAAALAETGNASGAMRLLHEIRGVASFLQARNVAGLAGSLEETLKAGADGQATASFSELHQAMAALAEAIPALETLAARHGPDAEEPPASPPGAEKPPSRSQ